MRAVADLLDSIAWPLAVVVALVIFRREISQAVKTIRKVEFPGGSLTLGDVERVAQDVQRASGAPTTPPVSPETPAILGANVQVTLGALIVDIEQELLKLWQYNRRGELDVAAWSREAALSALRTSQIITPELERAAMSWFFFAEEVLKGFALLDPAIPQRTVASGYVLLESLRRRRIVARLLDEFDGHLLWIAHPGNENPRYIWSALAAESPEFEYDLESFNEAVRIYLARTDERAMSTIARPVEVSEYVKVLRFRESELLRVLRLNAFYDPHGRDQKPDYEWKWPDEWGYIGWGGPVVHGWRWDAERELVRTRSALARYEAALAMQFPRPSGH